MKGADSPNPDPGFLRPWIIGAAAWGILACILLDEYKRKGDPLYLPDIFLILTLLWLQFGFAAIFQAVYSGRFSRLSGYTAVTLVPPLIVYLLMVW